MAAPTFDKRLLKVGIQAEGAVRYYEDLDITVNAVKNQNWTQNEGSVTIANLTRELREKILTENRLFNRPLGGKNKLVVEAGRESYGYTKLFVGNIRRAIVSQPPDIAVEIEAYTGGNLSLETTAINSREPQKQLSAISNDVAGELGLSLVFEAMDKAIGAFSFTGAKTWLLKKLSEAGNVTAYIDNEQLIVKDRNQPLKGNSFLVSAENGMIGVPELTEMGVSVRTMFSPAVRVGGTLQVQSKINPAANGSYIIVRVGYSLQNRGNDFYCDIEGVNSRYLVY